MNPLTEQAGNFALVLPSEEKIKELDALAREYEGLLTTDQTPFHASLHLALAMNQLRSKLTAEIMKPMMALMNTPLGFLTDRTGKPNARGETKPLYDVSIVRDCLIEGLLRGFMPVNNEINIIASRCYPAKNGLSRKVKQFPGLTDYKDSFTVPRISEGKGAVIACSANWKLNSKEDRIEREFAIKGDSYATADSYLGKAQRKLYHAVFERISGQSLPEGEVTDEDLAYAKDVTPREKHNPKETKKVEKPDFGETKPAPVETGEPAAHQSAQADAEPEEPAGKRHRKPTIPAKPTAASQQPPAQPDYPPAEEEIGQTRQSTFSPPSDEKSSRPGGQDRFRNALRECGYDQSNFLSGLKLIEFPGVAADVEILEELPEEICEKILTRGLEHIMAEVRDVKWMRGMK